MELLETTEFYNKGIMWALLNNISTDYGTLLGVF